MHPVDLIIKKRQGGELTPEEIRFIVAGAVDQSISSEQLSAWLMATFLRTQPQRGKRPDHGHALLRRGL